jgi:hypothetical protein
MAQEITLTLKMSVSKGFLVQKNDPGTILVDMSGTTATGGAQDIGTSTNAETITMSDVSSAGYAYFRNTDATNFVEIGTGTGVSFAPFIKLKAGEAAICRLGTNTPTAKANAAAVKLQYYIIAD